ncbi:MAG: isoprenoid biosynthesis glyoxalase ElbB [Marinilabiliaceae bacterium]|nr:isoprenoid biosynthesis glyoxalase ElbB [Marinilabiliaceae bacterium]
MSAQKNIAVVLSGCGVYDGAEIHESVFTLYAIEQLGYNYQIYAPDITQAQVINHTNGNQTNESRNVLIESARIARGNIKPLNELKCDDHSAIIFPGGFGVAKNLCSFAIDGSNCSVNKDVETVIKTFHKSNKPIGAMCISPALIVRVLNTGEVTIGDDTSTATAIVKMGGKHANTNHEQIVIDNINKLVSTPCYMLNATISQIANGTMNLVKAVIKLSN